ncbi:MAG: hypothetical protein QG610_1077 [Euryarchaeota archaeon]|nr:hypothetical protein [Euryarchaeota archaeon]
MKACERIFEYMQLSATYGWFSLLRINHTGKRHVFEERYRPTLVFQRSHTHQIINKNKKH